MGDGYYVKVVIVEVVVLILVLVLVSESVSVLVLVETDPSPCFEALRDGYYVKVVMVELGKHRLPENASGHRLQVVRRIVAFVSSMPQKTPWLQPTGL